MRRSQLTAERRRLMSRIVTLATCQPPLPAEGRGADEVLIASLDLLREAAERGADIACLPEYLNMIGELPAQAAERIDRAPELLEQFRDLARSLKLAVVLPLLISDGTALRNRAFVIDDGGEIAGHYDKTHLVASERDEWGIAPGDVYPVFNLAWGKVGVMICYDGCFPEPARILALSGAEVIFFPSLQRGWSERELDLQVRARAFDNYLHVVRSSWGTPREEVWRPGTPVGKSCIAGPDGNLLADLGRFTGVATAVVDLDKPLRGERTHGGQEGPLGPMRLADRRPATYLPLTEPQGGA